MNTISLPMRHLLLLTLGLLLLALHPGAFAQRVALVIGNGKYQH